MFSNGILIRKIFARETGVDERDCGSVLAILLGEGAAALDGNAHGLVVARIDKIEERERHVVIIWGLGLAFEPERNLGVSGHRQRAAHERNRFHAANALELAQILAVHGAKLVGGQGPTGTRRDAE